MNGIWTNIASIYATIQSNVKPKTKRSNKIIECHSFPLPCIPNFMKGKKDSNGKNLRSNKRIYI